MGCGVTIVMADSGGGQWLLGVDNIGELTTLSVSNQTVSAPILADLAFQRSWTLGVTTLGALMLTDSGAAQLSQNTSFLLGSPSNVYYYVSILAGGILETILANIPNLAPVVLGELFNGDLLAMYPQAAQPGGIGTPVTDPTQSINEKNGKFFPGCTHSINSYDVAQASVNCVPMKVIRCPICGFCQRLMSVADFYNNDTNPVLYA